jgi:FMN phosphatase YigB (HAD superfamily)
MSATRPVFLLDVDNTLIDNDAVVADLKELRQQQGYADYLGALQRYRLLDIDDPHMLLMSSFLVDYPFPKRVFPNALEVIAQLATVGTPVVLSDGDVVFQPRKIQKSGIWDAVEGRVLIYIHKELKIDAMRERYPADHYFMIDDKVRILHAMKDVMGDSLTTVFPRQGHYALDPKQIAAHPTPDMTVERIGDLLQPALFSQLMSGLD